LATEVPFFIEVRNVRILIGLLILLWTTSVFAEHNGIKPDEKNLPMTCGDSEHLLTGIAEKYGEEMVFFSIGRNMEGHQLSHSLWINYNTKTWTFFVVNNNLGVSCVMASGDNLNMLFPGKGI